MQAENGRDLAIYDEWVKTGNTYKAIGQKHGLTASRVGQICREYRVPAGLNSEIALADPFNLFDRSLFQPFNPSQLVTRKGLRVFDEMRRDDQVKAALAFKKLSVLASGWEIRSPEGRAEKWEPTRFVKAQLLDLPGTLNHCLRQVMSALDYGYSVTEKIFEEIPDGEFAGKVGLTGLKTKKPHSFDFDTDQFGNLKRDGILQEALGTTPGVSQRRLPTVKFIHYAHGEEFQNPYGTSDLEAAYRAWFLKDHGYKWLGMSLERFGVPPLFALYGEGYTPPQIDQLKKVVDRLQAGTAGVVPKGKKGDFEFWQPDETLGKNSIEGFITALKMFNEDISRAQLMPGLLGLSSDTVAGSFARAKVAFDVFLLMTDFVRGEIEERVMADQLIRQLVDLNYAVDEYPQFKFLPIGDDMSDELLRVWSEMAGLGVVSKQPEDEDHIRAGLGFPERGENAEREEPEDDEEDEPDPDDTDDEEDDAPEATAEQRQFQLSRQPNKFEKRVDFAQINRQMDGLQGAALDVLKTTLTDVRDRTVRFVGNQFGKPEGLTARFIANFKTLRGIKDFEESFGEFLTTTFSAGRASIRAELKGVGKFAEEPNFLPRDAIKALDTDRIMGAALVEGALLGKTRRILQRSLETGETRRETEAKLRGAFEEFVGDETVLRDDDIVRPARLETIVRTNTTSAFNRGRLVQGRQNDLVEGFEFSAILDSRTTAVCVNLDGRVFKRDDPNLDRLRPPRHFNCRSLLVALTLDIQVPEDDFISPQQIGRGLELSGEGFR